MEGKSKATEKWNSYKNYCVSSGPDINNPACQYVTDKLVVVKPPPG